MSALIQLDKITLSFGGRPLLDGADMIVSANDKVALVGRNGSGKSTLLKIIAGQIEAQDGTLFRQPDATVRYLPQVPDFAGFDTVSAYVEAGLGPLDETYRVDMLLDALGISGTANPHDMSGGEARRAALARVMAPNPDILLLDEPTNHLDLPTIEWLEGELAQMRSALIVISHDRRFLENVSRKTLWLDRGQTKMLNKGFAEFEPWRDAELELEELNAHKLKRKIAREEDWLRYGVSARRTRNMRRLGELFDMRSEYRNRERAVGGALIETGDTPQSGKKIIEAFAIAKHYGDRSIINEFSTRIHRGDKIGLAGANGSGKTTLLNILTGLNEPDSGSIKLGANLEVARFDQTRSSLNGDETLAHYLSDGRGDTMVVHGNQRHVTAYMKDFLFRPEQARTPISALSGGEQARLMLAKIFAKPANVLILDEPTNDLDIETLDLLQEAIAAFDGTVLLVSHDRDFLDRTVTSLIVAEGNGEFTTYAGGYADMLNQRGASPFGKMAAQNTSAKRSPAKLAAIPKAPKQKLSFKQNYALENLPKDMDALRLKISNTEKTLSDPSLFTKDPKTFSKLSGDLEKFQKNLATKEDEWLELEMLREELS